MRGHHSWAAEKKAIQAGQGDVSFLAFWVDICDAVSRWCGGQPHLRRKRMAEKVEREAKQDAEVILLVIEIYSLLPAV